MKVSWMIEEKKKEHIRITHPFVALGPASANQTDCGVSKMKPKGAPEYDSNPGNGSKLTPPPVDSPGTPLTDMTDKPRSC